MKLLDWLSRLPGPRGMVAGQGAAPTSPPPRPTRGCANCERLERELDEAQLRSIEARNPGIDMDEVRRIRGPAFGKAAEDA